MRAIIIDDHKLFATGLKGILTGFSWLSAVECYAALDQAWPSIIAPPKPSLIILDFYMPGLDIHAAIPNILARLPSAKIVIVSSSLRQEDRQAALSAGAHLFLTKHVSPELLVSELEKLMAGNEGSTPADAPDEQARRFLLKTGLTDRQVDVLMLLNEGLTNKQIARRLSLSPETIKTHIRDLCQRLHVANRAEAVHWAHRNGLC